MCDQGPGEESQAAFIAECRDRRGEEINREVKGAHPEGGRCQAPRVDPGHWLRRSRALDEVCQQLVDVVLWRDRAHVDAAGVVLVRGEGPRCGGDLRPDLDARVDPPAPGRCEVEEGQTEIGLAVLARPPRGGDDGPEIGLLAGRSWPAERERHDPRLAAVLERPARRSARPRRASVRSRPCGRSRSRHPRRAGAACYVRGRRCSGWPPAGAPRPQWSVRRAGSPGRLQRRGALQQTRRACRSRPRDAMRLDRSRRRRLPGRVGTLPVGDGCALLDRRPDERMAEPKRRAVDLDEPRRRRPASGPMPDAGGCHDLRQSRRDRPTRRSAGATACPQANHPHVPRTHARAAR